MPLFRTSKTQEPKPASPALLFRDLPRDPSIKFLWGHQEKLLDEYHPALLGKKDVAVELPTGSGKTLVGLLIGEYRRRALSEQVVFLCPNKQLCCQVEAQAKKYGIPTSLLIGPQKDYDLLAFTKYQQAKAIAISTYSGLFNSNPKISTPQAIICDDAHAADGFVASMWTFRVDRDDHEEFFLKLYHAIKPAVPRWLAHAVESYDGNPRDRGGVDLATPILAAGCFDDVRAVVKKGLPDEDGMKYPWEQISDHLDACLIFCSPTVIEARPIIPPTKVHRPFAGANQRVYMSATLGEDGSIERSFGVAKIERLPIPEGWDKKGTGRRLVLFPMLSGQETPVGVLQALISEADRALVLVPSEAARKKVVPHLPEGYTVFNAQDVEKGMATFTAAQKAILLLANRYDGIDLPGTDCRMLVVYHRPTGATLLERYFLERLGATSVLRVRIRTRITQAMGRCTRDEGDFSVVVLMGEDILDWCSTTANVSGLHPEIQAEISFGLENSENRSKGEMVDLCRALLGHTAAWKEEAEPEIQVRRNSVQKQKDAVTEVLAKAAPVEPDVQAHLAGRPVSASVPHPVQDWFLALRSLLEYLGRIGKRCVPILSDRRTDIQATESKRFEKGLEMLGRLLGAEAKNFLGQKGPPDGFWLFGDRLAFVFEAKTDEQDDNGISLNTVRQASSHETTVRSMKLLPDYVRCVTVVVSSRKALDKLAVPHAGEIVYMSHDDIIALFDRASQAFREVRDGSSGNTDEVLRERFLNHYMDRKLLMQDVADLLQKTKLASLPVKGRSE